jgi:hypothetical protein
VGQGHLVEVIRITENKTFKCCGTGAFRGGNKNYREQDIQMLWYRDVEGR